MDLRQLERKLSASEEYAPATRAPVLVALDQFATTIDASIRTIRTLVTELRLELLEEVGLRAAAEWQVRQFEQRTGIACEFSSDIEQLGWDRNQSIAICRILQESLSNVARHAQATHVEVRLTGQPDELNETKK